MEKFIQTLEYCEENLNYLGKILGRINKYLEKNFLKIKFFKNEILKNSKKKSKNSERYFLKILKKTKFKKIKRVFLPLKFRLPAHPANPKLNTKFPN